MLQFAMTFSHAVVVFLCVKYKISKTKTPRPRAQGCFGEDNNKGYIISANVIPVFTVPKSGENDTDPVIQLEISYKPDSAKLMISDVSFCASLL